ncbi:MAG: DUF4255 domain-containing protein, partial [Chloroflexia bacterium]|nr:DUF4255 domain-containing protein [Chloroflexia bacterium]
MSDFRAIAGVSATLRTLLQDRMELPAGLNGGTTPPPIAIGTPLLSSQQLPDALEPEAARLNLFLFQVSEHPQLRNRDLPGRGSGLDYGKPPLSLTLNFMLTAYGSDVSAGSAIDETVAQYLLGSAMRVFHDYAIITPQLQTVREPYGQPILHESLRGSAESIKLCLAPMTLEDLTKIWTALTIPYRMSVAYTVSVVQIESRAVRRYPRLVGERPDAGPGIVAVPLDRPLIDGLRVIRLGESGERSTPYARIGDTLVINGQNFGRVSEVEINQLRIPVEPVSPTRIEVVVPDTAIAGETIPPTQRLQPGPQPVEVVSQIEGVANFRLRSNRADFMLVPLISAVVGTVPRTLTISGQRLYLADSNMQTLVGYALFDSDAYDSASPSQITLTLPDVLPLRTATAFVGAPITDLSALDATPEIVVAFEGAGSQTLTFSLQPDSLPLAARELENRLRGAPTEERSFKGARVAVLDNRLLIVPGGASGTVTVQASAGNNAAGMLGLQTGSNRSGYLSGMLRPVPTLSSSTPQVRIEMDGQTFDAALGSIGSDLQAVATALERAIQAGPTAAFTDTAVVALADQLLILTGDDRPILFVA